MIVDTHEAEVGLFYCPIRSTVHPGVEAVARRSSEWMIRLGLTRDEHQHRRLMATNSAEFYGRIAPTGLEDRLQIAADWCYWGFAFDDAWSYDDRAMARLDELLALVGRLLRMLETRDLRPCEGIPGLAALHDVIVRFSRCATPVQMRRLVEAHRLWLLGMAQRCALQARGEPPRVDDYLAMRLHDCGGAPCTAMLDIVNGMQVPSAQRDSPAVQALTEAAWMVAALDNERVSHAKEVRGEARVENLVDVLVHERGCSPQHALREAVMLRDRVMCLFLRLREQVAATAGPALHRYVTDLGHLVAGNIEWSLRTARYTTVYGAGAAPVGAVTLSFGWAPEPSDGRLEPLPYPSIAWWWSQLDPDRPVASVATPAA